MLFSIPETSKGASIVNFVHELVNLAVFPVSSSCAKHVVNEVIVLEPSLANALSALYYIDE